MSYIYFRTMILLVLILLNLDRADRAITINSSDENIPLEYVTESCSAAGV